MNNEVLMQINQLLSEGEYGSVKIICMDILSHTPDDPDVLYMLGSIYLVQKHFEESRKLLERLVARRPEHINGLNNLGNCYLSLGIPDQAAQCFHRVLAVDAEEAIALNNLGAIASGNNDHQQAVQYYQRAIAVLPDDEEVMANLIVSYIELGKPEKGLKLALDALKMHEPGVSLFPAFNVAKQHCYWEETNNALPKLLKEIEEGRARFSELEHVNLSLLTFPNMKHQTLFKVLKKSGESIENMRVRNAFHHDEYLLPSSKKWRVGYLSPDFRNHVVSSFLRGLINNHDREEFEVYCYSNTRNEDEITAQYRQAADVFVDVTVMTDQQLAERIYEDGIHFLVDLAGFTQHGRLPVLSYSPAPVQIMYLGYPYTSGLASVDYYISDPYLDGPKNAAYFTEKQLRLPESFVSFGHLGPQEIAADIPWTRNRYITFGSLINPYKLNLSVISLWSKILSRLEDSRLVLNHPVYRVEAVRNNLSRAFKKEGINADRVNFISEKHVDGNFLKYYNDIDIVLDPFPATGGTTTHDALWMGKPVVTLVGEIFPERLSYSILKNTGLDLEDLIAFDQKNYVAKAVSLAKNPERIKALLRDIPQSLKSAILCDPVRFACQIEAAYLSAWRDKYDSIPVPQENLKKDALISSYAGPDKVELQDG